MAENMNTIAPNDYSDARWSRFPFWAIVQGLLALAVLTTQQAQAAVECEAFRWESERLDFNAAKDQRRISARSRITILTRVLKAWSAARPVVSPALTLTSWCAIRPIIIEVWRRSFGFR